MKYPSSLKFLSHEEIPNDLLNSQHITESLINQQIFSKDQNALAADTIEKLCIVCSIFKGLHRQDKGDDERVEEINDLLDRVTDQARLMCSRAPEQGWSRTATNSWLISSSKKRQNEIGYVLQQVDAQ